MKAGEFRAELRFIECRAAWGAMKPDGTRFVTCPDLARACVQIEGDILFDLFPRVARREHFDANLRRP